MKKTALCAGLAAALSYLSTPAFAAPVTIDGSIANGSLLGAGIAAGAFDGAALLPKHYQINSATYLFTFSDDADGFTTGGAQATGASYGSYTYGGWSSWYESQMYYRDVTQYQSVLRSGQQEGASLSLGGLAAGAGATSASFQSSPGSPVYQGQVLDSSTFYPGYYYSCGNHSTCWSGNSGSRYYSNDYTATTYNTQDWTGSFAIGGTITDQSLLEKLLNNKQLDFSLSVYGDLYLVGSRLSLDVTELAPASADVPEPSSLSLALGALVALGYSLRRRRGASQESSCTPR